MVPARFAHPVWRVVTVVRCPKRWGGQYTAVAAVNESYNPHCSSCVEACESEAITLNDRGSIDISADRCTGCGECALDCFSKAIDLVKRGT